MFGGGGGNGKSNEPQGVQMTVAVDRQTSSLVISSSEALFTKVQEMVKESDEAAKKSNVLLFLAALEQCLNRQGIKPSPGASIAAANAVYCS